MEYREVFVDFEEFCNTCFKDIDGLLKGYTTKFQTRALPDSTDPNDVINMLQVTGLMSPHGGDVELVIRCRYAGVEVDRKAWFVYLAQDESLHEVLKPAHSLLQATSNYFKSLPVSEETFLQ
jgi:hypothetical protein